jgi:inosose dehydratase
MSDFLSRVAGAPITWGVDGSPGWGHLMDRRRVLGEMQAVGMHATELGPDGYLPTDPEVLEPMLDTYGLQLVGGFVPVTLYRSELLDRELANAAAAADTLSGAGAHVFVLGPASTLDGYDTVVELTDDEWVTFDRGLRRLMTVTEERGMTTALHSHWGMAVDRPHHIERLLSTCPVGICLDTGHIALAGGDPLEVAKMAGDRVVHVHLKDVDERMAEQVRAGERPFRKAVIDGLFKPLGEGFVDIAGVIRHLEANGFTGWYVLEQDQALSEAPAEGEGPIHEAITSMDYLRRLDL